MALIFPLHGVSLSGTFRRFGVPAIQLGNLPMPQLRAFTISGVTRDSAGAVLVSCVVELFRTEDDVEVDSTVSDGVTGAYVFNVVGLGQQYYAVAYKTGVPDVAGTTVQTIQGL